MLDEKYGRKFYNLYLGIHIEQHIFVMLTVIIIFTCS